MTIYPTTNRLTAIVEYIRYAIYNISIFSQVTLLNESPEIDDSAYRRSSATNVDTSLGVIPTNHLWDGRRD